MAMTRFVSCLHNRNRLAGATIAVSIIFLIETPRAAETPRARCALSEDSTRRGEAGIEPWMIQWSLLFLRIQSQVLDPTRWSGSSWNTGG